MGQDKRLLVLDGLRLLDRALLLLEEVGAAGCDPRSLTNVNNQEEWRALLTGEA